MSAVPGYDYPAFLHAVIIGRGHGCWVGGLLRARREHWRRSRAPGDTMPPELDPALLGCQGQLDAHHLVPKQRIKREFHRLNPLDEWPVRINRAWADGGSEFVSWESLAAMLMDARNGVIVCRRHHDLLERRLVVPARAELPRGVEEFAAVVGMGWSLDRDYGPVKRAA